MRHRHAISDEHWERIRDLLPGKPGDPGVTAKDNRLFIDAVLWIARTGAPWRDLPEHFGNWYNIWKRFSRWAKKGVWQRAFEVLPELPSLKRQRRGLPSLALQAWEQLGCRRNIVHTT